MINILKELTTILNEQFPHLHCSLTVETDASQAELSCINIFLRKDVEESDENGWLHSLALITIDENIDDPTLYITTSKYNVVDINSMLDMNIIDLPIARISFVKSHDVHRHLYRYADQTESVLLADPHMYDFVVRHIKNALSFVECYGPVARDLTRHTTTDC